MNILRKRKNEQTKERGKYRIGRMLKRGEEKGKERLKKWRRKVEGRVGMRGK